MKLTLEFVSRGARLAVIRYPPTQAIPFWILSTDDDTVATTSTATTDDSSSSFLSITRTNDELSLVCPEHIVPPTLLSAEEENKNKDTVQIERGWMYFKVCGPLDFGLTGILAGLAQPLATAGISIFAISTYDTDYILVKQESGEAAATVLERLGHTVVRK